VDPQPGHPLRHVVLDDPSERLPASLALPLVVVETVGLSVLFAAYVALDADDSALAPLLIPPVVTLAVLVAMPRSVSSRPLRILLAYTIAAITGLLVTAAMGHSIVLTVAIGFLTLLLMHTTGTMHPPAVAAALVASRSQLDGLEAALALPFLLGVMLVVLAWAWVGHRLLGDRDYPQKLW
jgi:CBS-domain-containing membrane protein